MRVLKFSYKGFKVLYLLITGDPLVLQLGNSFFEYVAVNSVLLHSSPDDHKKISAEVEGVEVVSSLGSQGCFLKVDVYRQIHVVILHYGHLVRLHCIKLH